MPRSPRPSPEKSDALTARAFASAPAAALPAKLSPQLATLTTTVPIAGRWIYEIKFDGYRILGRIEAGKVKLFTRSGHDWTSKMESLAREVERSDIRSAWLDCEAVVLGPNGLPSFNALQNAFDRTATEDIVLYVFDVPFLDGKNLCKLPLEARRAVLKERLAGHPSERIRFSESFGSDGASVLQSACKMGLEGVIAKRADAPYEMRRTQTWLKVKCQLRQEFVVGGFADRAGGHQDVGSLLLAVYDDEGKLHSVGSVGTGWGGVEGAAMRKRLSKIRTEASPFDPRYAPEAGRWSKRERGSERWVEPTLVVEVSFTEWTADGNIRHPSFVAFRDDKAAATIRREKPQPQVASPTGAKPAKRPSSIKVSNPERVIDPTTGLKKIDLVRYYESIADWILPHLKGRPTSLVRGPTGVTGALFFQKHGEKIGIPGIRQLDPSLWPGYDALLEIPSTQALVGAAQLNVIEFHTWNSTTAHINEPDRIVFDLDPGEGVSWPKIQEAAALMRVLLTELGLETWLKTSGGKGLHVVVPITPKLDYATVSDFSRAVVMHLATTIPSRFVAKSGGGNRIGKIFVDYLRNGHGATTATAYSARARPGLGVSMPITWEQLDGIGSGAEWSIATAADYVASRADDPWAAYWSKKETLAKPMKILGVQVAKEVRR